MIALAREGTPPKEIIMTTRTKALAGASFALALALTGCTAEKSNDLPQAASTTASASQSSASPAPSSSPASSSASESPSASASPSQGTSSSAAPQFTEVTSEQPKDDQAAQIKGFEAVQLYYDITHQILTQDKVDKELLSLAVREPYLSHDAEAMRPIEESDETYSGESKVELISAIIAPTRNAQGDDTQHANAQLLVCEDNTGVVVKDKDGKRVSSGSVLRYQTTYIVTWQQDDQAWKIVTREVMRDEKGNPKTC